MVPIAMGGPAFLAASANDAPTIDGVPQFAARFGLELGEGCWRFHNAECTPRVQPWSSVIVRIAYK